MKSRFRPRRSVRYPNSSAPATAPSRYHVPAELACLVVRFSVSDFVRTLASEPTSVTSKPSRIHVIPSPITTIQCHLLHGSRSSRRGIIVSTTPPVAPRSRLAVVAVIATHELDSGLRVGSSRDPRQRDVRSRAARRRLLRPPPASRHAPRAHPLKDVKGA